MVGNPLGAELDPRVGAVADELHLQPQLEIAVGPLRAEELVAGDLFFERPADNRPVLDPEDLESPSQPSKVLPSKIATGFGEPDRWASTAMDDVDRASATKQMMVFMSLLMTARSCSAQPSSPAARLRLGPEF